MLSENQVVNFLKKGQKCLGRYIQHTNDYLGAPSIIKITNSATSTYTCYSLTQSSERHFLLSAIVKVLENNMFLPKEECKQISEYYVQEKYQQYIDFVMSS